MKVRILLVSLLATLVLSSCVSSRGGRFTYEIEKPVMSDEDSVTICTGVEGYEYDVFLVNEDDACEPEGVPAGVCISNDFTKKLLHYIKSLEIRMESIE